MFIGQSEGKERVNFLIKVSLCKWVSHVQNWYRQYLKLIKEKQIIGDQNTQYSKLSFYFTGMFKRPPESIIIECVDSIILIIPCLRNNGMRNEIAI